MEKISKNQVIAIIIATIVSIILAVIINCNIPEVRTAFTQPKPTEQSYEILKSYALGVAKGQYSGQNPEKLQVVGPIIEEVLKVNIKTSQMYGVEVEFPINYEVNKDFKNGIIEIKGNILYDEATYLEYIEVSSQFRYILIDVLSVAGVVILTYCITYEIERKLKKELK